ncbi:hypothetical protein BU17DRAFT_88768 [Hysterangium stoloniferum]|nr:hypothetical protein BU17DRAFT_88768 [Hysterangium stoloniferum]
MSEIVQAIDRIVVALNRLTGQLETAQALQKTETEAAVIQASPAPPQILVEHNGRTIVVGRMSLITPDMRLVYSKFSYAFDLPEESKQSTRILNERISWTPMKVYVTFRYGPSSNGEYHEVPTWAKAWGDLVPNVDRIRIYTLEEIIEGATAAAALGKSN